MADDARMDAAVKDEDGFFATFLVSSWSPHLVRWAAARRITPNQVTAVSNALTVAAAAAFATGVRPGLVIGAVLVQAAFVADCVDGQLARYTGTGTPLGAWLDAVSDRAKELVIYAGLAVGGAQDGEPGIWLLASCALALLALRHQTDFAYAAQHGPDPGAPGAESGWTVGVTGQVGLAGVRTAATLERSWLRWIKRIIVLPIGERFALISITAAVAGPRTTFVALLGWGGVAAVYMVTGRILRSLADADGSGRIGSDDRRGGRGRGGEMTAALTSHRDDGPLARALGRLAPDRLPPVWTTVIGCTALANGLAVDGARTSTSSAVGVGVFVLLGALSAGGRGHGHLRWAVPPLLHAGEYGTLIVLAWRTGMPPAAFALLAAVAAHHYDLAYRRGPAPAPRPVDLLAGGWEGRTLALMVASLAGLVGGVSLTLALWVALLVVVSATQRVRALAQDGLTTHGRTP
ncbi:MAG TPA: DUF5941 domain-containing protein [Euzebyales bacterium]|nr:DUF5941 domain-containing protein [Euzebyales bacterium]